MKTAVSLPDVLYAEAEATAKLMHIPRSRLFALALEEFIALHKRERITEKLNEVYAHFDDRSESCVADAGLASLRELTQHDAW